jgi:alpha-beta hydrolase superfamily lysophospholipase
LAGTSYSTKGWAVEAALSDQVQALGAISRLVGHDTRVIVWGESMGGLIAAGIAQLHDISSPVLCHCAPQSPVWFDALAVGTRSSNGG